MKLLVDLFPVILFFIAYKTSGIYVATGVAIAAAALQVIYHKIRHGKVEKMHWVTLVILIVFGGLTIALRDPTFIKWKPTVVNWIFATALLGTQFFMQRSLLQRMMDHAVTLPDAVWKKLNYAWVTFFTSLGFVNLYVAYNYSEETWVNFKLFGFLGLTIVFMIGQGFYLAKYIQEDDDPAKDEP